MTRSIVWKEIIVARKKRTNNKPSPMSELMTNSDHYIIPENGRVIENGEVIKIAGEHGVKFKFTGHVLRNDTGIEWINCYELERGVIAKQRSFRPDRIRPLPRKRVKKFK